MIARAFVGAALGGLAGSHFGPLYVVAGMALGAWAAVASSRTFP